MPESLMSNNWFDSESLSGQSLKTLSAHIAIIDEAPLPFAINDARGNITHLNKGFIQTIGYTTDDIPTLEEWWPLAYPDSQYRKWVTETWRNNLEESRSANKPFQPMEVMIHCKDGLVRTFMASSTSLIDQSAETHLVMLSDITARKQAEDALAKSEMRFRRILELAPIGMATNSLEGDFILVNQAFCNMLGYDKSELGSMTYLDVTHPDDKTLTFAAREQLLEGKIESYQMEKRFVHKNGQIVWGLITSSVEMNNFGAPPFFIAQIENITGRKLSETLLREGEARFRTILEHAPIGMAIALPDGQIIEVNQVFCTMLGYEKEEFKKLTFREMTHPDDLPLTLANRQRLLGGEVDFYRMEKRFFRKDGQIVWVQLISSMQRDGSGLPLYNIAQIEDISARKTAENKLRQNEENLRAILDNSPYLTWLKDTDGRYLHVNHAYANYPLLKTGKQIIGMTDFDLWPKEIAEKYRADDTEVMANRQQQRRTEECFIDGTRTYWAETFKTAIIGKDGHVTGTTGFSRDITHRKATEQQLHDLTAHLLNVREDEKASIAREIHDELGGIMTALKIKIYQLKSILTDATDAVSLAEQIKSMEHLINNAAVISRTIISNLHPTILDDLGLLAAIEWQAGEFHKLTGIATMVNCIGDKENLDKQTSIALFRILQEALTNVARHSGASQVGVEYHHSDDEVMLSISDNGCGLPDDRRTQPRSYGLMGMQERVAQLGGTIKFDSSPDGGFCVIVTLPPNSTETRSKT